MRSLDISKHAAGNEPRDCDNPNDRRDDHQQINTFIFPHLSRTPTYEDYATG